MDFTEAERDTQRTDRSRQTDRYTDTCRQTQAERQMDRDEEDYKDFSKAVLYRLFSCNGNRPPIVVYVIHNGIHNIIHNAKL